MKHCIQRLNSHLFNKNNCYVQNKMPRRLSTFLFLKEVRLTPEKYNIYLYLSLYKMKKKHILSI